jgi:phospho-N-acetylmuramoyl-pentapeptide-transferase
MEQIIQVMRFIIITVFSFGVGMFLVSPVEKLIRKLNSRKRIAKEGAPIFSQMHAQKEGTPVMAGVIIWGTALIVIFLLFSLSLFFNGFWGKLSFLSRSQTYLPLAGMLLAAFAGAADDIAGILRFRGKNGFSLKERLAIFFFVALIGAWWFATKLEWDILYIPFIGGVTVGSLAYAVFFILVVMATSFSLDLTNGLDGLAEGVALIALSCLAVVAFANQKYDLAMFAGSLIGGLVAFLWFNIYPARFFMGDTGAMSLGVAIAIIALLTNTAILLPFFAFILIVESLSDLIQLFSKKFLKKKVFISAPIHHHFEAKGWPEPQITMRFWIVSGIMASLGLIIFFLDKFLLS